MGFKVREDSSWSGRYPELENFLVQIVAPVVDGYGMVYLEAMNKAWDEYGLQGVSVQLLYIANNLKFDDRVKRTQIDRHLCDWSKYLEDVEHNIKPDVFKFA